jgi:hypothetical protein
MKNIIRLASALILSVSLSGCVVEPAPYYTGGAPSYGTTYVPAYAYGEVAVGGYYPYHRSQHIYSNYNANYWHHQRSVQVTHNAPQHSSGGHEDGRSRR